MPSLHVLHASPAPRGWRRLWLPALAVAVIAAVSFAIVGPFHLASADESPLSQGKPATASSVEGPHWAASAAVDGAGDTRWSSAFSDPQWLQVDLGGQATIDRIVLKWESAYATAFQLQVSPDGNAFTPVFQTADGRGGTQTVDVSAQGRYVRLYGTARATRYGYSLWEFQVFGSLPGGGAAPSSASTSPVDDGQSPVAGGSPSGAPATGMPSMPGMPTTGGDASGDSGYVMADPPVTGVVPSKANPPHRYFHEFQANCAVTHHAPDDPIVFFDRPGASHDHTFMGNVTTDAVSTTASLRAGGTECKVPGDKSGYWMPTVFNGDQVVLPEGPQVIYYKTGVNDYTSVRPFPAGLRFVVGSPMTTAAQFADAPGYVAGWECGDSFHNIDFPATCPTNSELNIRMQAPSCWDGIHLDTPDHKSHMAYPVNGVCPTDHPVAVPMIEFKMAWPVHGDMSKVRLASGRGYSFHYDFFNAWDDAPLAALVSHCINGGLQCDARGYDEKHPEVGAALDANYQVPGSHTALNRAGWTVTTSTGNGTANILDGDLDTRWTTGVPMASGQSVIVDMHAVHPVSMVTVDSIGADWARAYTVYLSKDGNTWTAATTGVGFMPKVIAAFAPHDARYIKVVQMGSASNWWSIAELNAYSS